MPKRCESVLNRTFLLAFLLLLGGFASMADAQTPAVYRLKETPLGMEELIGGTVQSSLTSSYQDYNATTSTGLYNNISMPFTFTYFDRTVTTSGAAQVNPNGFVGISTTPFSYAYGSTSTNNYWATTSAADSATAPDYSIMLFWHDLIWYNKAGANISWLVSGTAPNRRLVIQYLKMSPKGSGVCSTCYTSTGAVGAGDLTGQVWLHETTNVVEVKYADAAGGMNWTSLVSATIGIRGSAAHASKAVPVALGQNTAPLTNYRFEPQFWSQWTGASSTSYTSSANWTDWKGAAIAPYATSSTSTNAGLTAYIPDTTSLNNAPLISSGNYYSAGLILDAGAQFTMTGGTLNLLRRGTGQFLNNGTFNMSGSSTLKIEGDLTNQGFFTASGGNTTVVLNGTSEYGSQQVLFGTGSFGKIEVTDGGSTAFPTTATFLDFTASAFDTLENEAGTFLQFQGSINLSTLPANALIISGGIGFKTGLGPTLVQIGNNATFGPMLFETSNASDLLTIEGSFDCASVNFVGDGDYVVSGSVNSSGRVGFNGNGSLTIGTDPMTPANLGFGAQTLLLYNLASVSVSGEIVSADGDTVDISISSQDNIFIGGGINAKDGFVTLDAVNDITVGGHTRGARGVIINNGMNVTLGTTGMNALSSDSDIEFKTVDSVHVLGTVVHSGKIILKSNLSTTIDGNINVATLTLTGAGTFNFGGDVLVDVYDSMSNSNVSIGGDFSIKGDVSDNGSGMFVVGGAVRLVQGAVPYSINFQNRALSARSLVAVSGAEVSVKGKLDLSATGLGNYALDLQAGSKVTLDAGLVANLTGAGEPVSRFAGDVTTMTGAGATRPQLVGGSATDRRARMILAQGSNINIDGLVLANFGNVFATHGLIIESGAIIANLDNLSITGSAAAKAAIKLGTGSVPPTINAIEIAGTSPASIDAENIANFLLVFTKGANAGGNLYGAGFELDPQNVIVWDGGTPLSITTGATLPRAPKTQPYSVELQTVGGNQPFTWSINPGTKPGSLSWLNIDQNTGRLFGTPPSTGPTGQQPPVSVIVVDSTPGASAVTKSFNIIIDPVPGDPLQIDNTSLPVAFEGVSYFASLVASGGSESGYVYTFSSGTLPAGLALDADFVNSGVIVGTPDFGSAGSYSLGFTVTDSNLNSSPIKFLTLTVAAGTPRPIFTTVSLPEATQGKSYSFQLRAANGTAPYEFEVVSQAGTPVDASLALPSGISMSESGLIYGKPNLVGPQAFYVLVRDAFGVPSAQPLRFSMEVKQVDLGPVSIDGTNKHGTGGSCALSNDANIWLVLMVLAGAMVVVLRRRQEA